MPLSVRWTCLASSVVTTSLVMMRTLIPRSSRRGVKASTIAVLPDPTGPPMPMRVMFFDISKLHCSVHEQADMRSGVDGRQYFRQWSKARHVRKPRCRSGRIGLFRLAGEFVENLLRIDVADLHQPQGCAKYRRRTSILVHDERLADWQILY